MRTAACDEFVTDLYSGNVAWLVVRSPAVHARILSIDTSAALAVSGVVDVLRGGGVAAFGHWGLLLRDRPLIAIDRVHCVGDPVAVIIAEDLGIAEDAAELIDVEYEELPRAATVEAALADGAPQFPDPVSKTP